VPEEAKASTPPVWMSDAVALESQLGVVLQTIDAQNFNPDVRFPQNRGFPAANFVFLKEKFLTKNIFQHAKI